MISLQVSQVAQITGGMLVADESSARQQVEGITWDSRSVTEGTIFLALPGHRVDGNDFCAAAIQAGAGAVICTREPDSSLLAIAGEFVCPLIIVNDGVLALQQLAGAWRSKLHAVVIGVTGSTGKTSTKDFLRSVLSRRFKTCATSGNHNNEIGVPATILAADQDCEVLIVELGMRGAGQIAQLCEFVRPSIGVVTNIGTSHLELLGSREAIADAKGELLRALPSTGLAVLNVDDPFQTRLRQRGKLAERGVKVLTYGFDGEADVRATEPSLDLAACASFDLSCEGRPTAQVKLAMPGRHNVPNALAAAAVGGYLGMPSVDIAAGLHDCHGSGMRMQIEHSRSGVTVLDDSYNANPDSMRASLSTLANMGCSGRHIAVLGDMGELGPDAAKMHAEIGEYAAESGVDLLVGVGTLSDCICRAAVEAGLDSGNVRHFDTVDEAQGFLSQTLQEGDLVLVKASRFMEMERIVKGVLE